MKRNLVFVMVFAVLSSGVWAYTSLRQFSDVVYGLKESRRVDRRSQEEQVRWRLASRRMLTLWHERDKKNIVPELLKLSSDVDPDLRERSVRLLGKAEDVRALAALKERLSSAEARFSSTSSQFEPHMKKNDSVPLEVLQLAVGRIEARQAKGMAKIDVLLRHCRFLVRAGQWRTVRWSDVIQFSSGASRTFTSYDQVPSGWKHVKVNSPAFHILHEVLDVLRQEKRRGVSVESLAKQLVLLGGYKVLLDTATLSSRQQIDKLFDYSFGIEGFDVADYWLVNDLMELPVEQIKIAVNERIKRVTEHPRLYPKLWKKRFGEAFAPGLDPVWKLSSIFGDNRTRILLKRFSEKYPTRWVGGEAKRSLEILEKNEGVVLFPI
ncbi:hypothetical protein B1R32_106145 [Abditibacterium utsteinense]|uniref:HEAT repeat-containing protein n=1 Tax=Abditibacterium utsteinense TaxID=1960156 RepID=A0A2S8SU70_9BACT|nr:HEAT repeat domain-containing protein [Abditibacterium utsteinense]PQV64299.1 hypothetical protein B1R32_106145 [Abditibacterium utsteinense]